MADSKRMIRRPVTMAVALLCLSVMLPTGAQEQDGVLDIAGVFTEVLDVRVVNVEVVVTDKDGIRVRGLQPEDFVLYVDGEERPIEYFSEIIGGEVIRRQPADGGGPSEILAMDDEGRVGTSYLVFIDNYFSIARDRDRLLKQLEEDIQSLAENDRMAIVAFDGEDLDMLTSWTSSQRQLTNAVRQAQDTRAGGLLRYAELRQNDEDRANRRSVGLSSSGIIAAQQASDSDIFRRRLEGFELFYAQRLADQLKRSVFAAVGALRGFASPPGRKVMLLMSGGWPYSPAEYTVSDIGSTAEEVLSGSLEWNVDGRERIYGALTSTANLLGYTIYPIDVPGNQRTGVDASVGFAPAVNQPISVGAGGFPREWQNHATLLEIAEETGGRALLNSQRENMLQTVVEDTRSYYWIGFSPNRNQDDENHDIRVEVRNKAWTVRSRESFVDLSRQSEVTMMVESALMFGNPPTSIPLALRWGKPKKAGRGVIEVPLVVGIPLDHVTLIPFNDKYQGQLEFRMSVKDNEGNRSGTPMQTVDIVGPDPPRPGQVFSYVTNVQMRKRPHEVVVAVFDPVSGNMMSSSLEIDP